MANRKLGCWILGAKGGVSTTMLVGVNAICKGLASAAGLVSENAPFNQLGLIPLEDIVWGGYEIRNISLYDSALEVEAQTGTLGYATLNAVKTELDSINTEIKDGLTLNCGQVVDDLADHELQKNHLPLAEAVQTIQQDLQDFVERHHLDHLVMLNLASTEAFQPHLFEVPSYHSLEELHRVIQTDQRENIAASSLYAYAALDLGYGYVNFTPSIGSDTPALDQLARERNTNHMGKDGKTGETLMKSVLAPMFVMRNMPVLSWAGFNILGDRDGQILNDPINKQSKLKSKDQTIHEILGEQTYTKTMIEYVPSLDDWKTAWDHIHFKGFLDTKMILQFIWQGCDSILAAPLALDLIRFTDFAKQQGEAGLQPHLACFFKSPQGVEEFSLHHQYQLLVDYAKAKLKIRD